VRTDIVAKYRDDEPQVKFLAHRQIAEV